MFTTRPELIGTFGMVASTHWLASAAGMSMLEKGGNAFDAAVAAGLVLQVVEPHLNGPGGDAVILLYSAVRDEVIVVDGQGPAPAAATIERFGELGHDVIPGTGILPACVPGAFGAWMYVLAEFGTMSVADVFAPAIHYAAGGFPVVVRIAEAIASVEGVFRNHWPGSAELYLANGVPLPGTLLTNESLAKTYKRIVDEASSTRDRDAQIERARGAYYEGFVADAIGAFVGAGPVADTAGRRDPALITADDMARWRARREDPVVLDYLDLLVCKAGAWTQGPVFLQQLALLKHAGISDLEQNSAAYVHAVVECAKLAFADREAWYGDPRYADVPLAELLSDDYAKKRFALVSERASTDLRPGDPVGRHAVLPSPVPAHDVIPGVGEPVASGPRDTCHVDVADAHGNLVAATPSGGWLQSSPVIPELGFPLGTRAQMFWLQPGLPNSLEPGKRPRTTLSPTIVMRDGRPAMAFGTPGGDQQDQWSLNFFLAHVHGGLNLQEAIDAPMFHTEHFPSSFYPRAASPGLVAVEERFDRSVVDSLGERGHTVRVDGPWSLGRVSAVARDNRGVLTGAANPRGMQGYAVGR